MKTLWRYLRIIRFPMTFAPVGAFIAGMIQESGKFPVLPSELLAMLAMFFLSAGTLAYNGFRDRDIDARKGESFAKQYPKKVQIAAILCYVACLAVAGIISLSTFLVFALYVGATIVYSRYGVRLPGLKNALASFLSASLVLFGAYVVGGINQASLITTLVFFFAITAMELVKDLEDIEADRGYRATLVMVLPLGYIKYIAGVCVAGAIAIGFLFPVRTVLFGILYTAASAAFVVALFRLPLHITTLIDHTPRRLIYVGLWIGLAAFILPQFLR